MLDLTSLDPTASLLDANSDTLAPNAMIVPDDFGLHQKVVFIPDELKRVSTYLSKQIKKCVDDRENATVKRSKNIEAYEGLSDKGESITLPFARQQANQQHAWLMDRFFSADPLISVTPLGDGKLHITVPDPDTGVVTDRTVSYSEEADDIEALLQFKWESRLPMRRVFSDFTMEALQDGTFPAVLKIIHDESKIRTASRRAPFQPVDEFGVPQVTLDGRPIQVVNAPEFRTVVDGESVQIINVPGDDFLVPFGHLSIQRAPWIAMRTEPSSSDIRVAISSGRWDFCHEPSVDPTDEEIDRVLFSSKDTSDDSSKRTSRTRQRVDKRREIDPSKTHEVFEVNFRWPILTPDDPSTITIMECVGDYHLESETLLSCWLLDSWNGKRPYIDWFMRQRPNSYSGTCTVEDVAPFQRYASNLFHLQVTNMVMRNISVIMVRKGTSTATFLSKRSNIRPGMVVQVDEMDDVKLTPLGTPIDSIASEINFLKQGATEMGLSTQYDNATADLSRVTSGAFAQQQDLSKMQPKQIYEGLAEVAASAALMYIQTLAQYASEQVIPHFDAATDATIQRTINLPREAIVDQFRFRARATATDETPEAQFQQDLVLDQRIDGANQFAMSILGQIMLPNVPPEFQEFGIFMISRKESMVASLFRNARRHDVSDYAMRPEMIKAMIRRLAVRAEIVAIQQQLAQLHQQAAANQKSGDVAANAAIVQQALGLEAKLAQLQMKLQQMIGGEGDEATGQTGQTGQGGPGANVPFQIAQAASGPGGPAGTPGSPDSSAPTVPPGGVPNAGAVRSFPARRA